MLTKISRVENPSINIDYTLTYKDFVAGHKLGIRKLPLFFAIYLLARYVASALAILILLMMMIDYFTPARSTLPTVLPLFLLVAFMSVIHPITWRICFNQLRSASSDPKMNFQSNDQSYSREIENKGEITWLWRATSSVSENKKGIAIGATRAAFIYIPRRAITKEQIIQLKEMFAQSRTK